MTNQDIMDMVPQSTSFTSASTSTTAEEDSFPEQTHRQFQNSQIILHQQ